MATQVHNLPKVPVSPVAVTRLLSRHTRVELESFVSVAIDLLDVLDGDADLEIEDPAGETVPVIEDPELPPSEDDGDPDLEEVGAEDSFMAHRWANGPGCEISDGDSEHDGREVTGAEDDFMCHGGSGPGCPVSDPGGYDEGY